jgi:hypothetical protein
MVVQVPEPYVTTSEITVAPNTESLDIDMNVQLTSGYKLKVYDVYARFVGTAYESQLTIKLDSIPVPQTPFDIRLLDDKLDKGISLTSPIVILWNKRLFVQVRNFDVANPLTVKITLLGEIVPEDEE